MGALAEAVDIRLLFVAVGIMALVIGFGLGMAGGRLLGNVANRLQGDYGFTINHWNVMETSCGFIAGFIYCFGMVGRAFPEPPEEKNISLASFYGIIYAPGLIPLWHRLNRRLVRQHVEPRSGDVAALQMRQQCV